MQHLGIVYCFIKIQNYSSTYLNASINQVLRLMSYKQKTNFALQLTKLKMTNVIYTFMVLSIIVIILNIR